MINPNSKYSMKTKIITTIAVIGLIPIIAFSQPPTPPAPPAPPAPPSLPGGREERMPKVPVTYLGVETSEVPSVLCDQLGIQKGFGLVVDYVVPDGPAAAADRRDGEDHLEPERLQPDRQRAGWSTPRR